jgi:ribosomal protein S18 acetylase RimI-like enzyme
MTTAPATFRRYRDDDGDAVWDVFAATTAQLGFAHGPWDDDMRAIPHTYLDAGGEFIVGELDGRIVAHAAFLLEPEGRARVHRVAVHPAVQRRGIGQALMAELEARARKRGIGSLQLDTSIGQSAAQSLYRRCGYAETGHVILSGVDCILYEKHLQHVASPEHRRGTL